MVTERMKLGFGVDLVVDEQCRRMAALGHDVVVLVLHADEVLPERAYRLFVIGRAIAQPMDYRTSEAMRHILAVADVGEIDAWILHTPPFYDWALYLDRPVVLVEYGAPPGSFFPSHVARHLDGMIEHRFTDIYGRLQPYDAIMSISRSIHDTLPSAVRDRSTVVHLGGDHYGQADPDGVHALRKQLAIAPHECMILWVGRMQLAGDEQPYKGFRDLRVLMPLVRRQVPGARFVLLGRVSEEDRIELERTGVRVLSNYPSHKMATAYAAADILLNMSRWEGFNLALLEAQFQGTPAVAYDYGPHCEIVRDGRTGLLAATPQALIEGVIRIARDRTLQQAWSAQAQAFARHFTWDRSTAGLLAIVERVVGDTPPSCEEVAHARARVLGEPQARASGRDRQATNRNKRLRRHALALRGEGGRGHSAFYDVVRTIASPQRYAAWHHCTDQDFIKLAYARLLEQEPDTISIENWLTVLRTGKPREDVLYELSLQRSGSSPAVDDGELQAMIAIAAARHAAKAASVALRPGHATPSSAVAFLNQVYPHLLRRMPSPEETVYWLGELAEAPSWLVVVDRLRASENIRVAAVSDAVIRGLLARGRLAQWPIVGCLIGDGLSGDMRRLVARGELLEIGNRTLQSDGKSQARAIRKVARQVGRVSQRVARVSRRIAAPKPQPALAASGTIAASSPLPAAAALSSHVLLLAPGAHLDEPSAAGLLAAAVSTSSDLLFGDDWQTDRHGNRSVRTVGAFSQSRFDDRPDLGSVIAVRRGLARKIGLDEASALTAGVSRLLVDAAHTISYLPVPLAKSDPVRPLVTARPHDVADQSSAEIRVSIVLIAPQRDIDAEALGRRLRATFGPARAHVTIVTWPEPITDSAPFPARLQSSYGRAVNAAVAAAPADCGAVLLLHGSIEVADGHWLDRLIALACHSEVGAVAPVTSYGDGHVRDAGMRFQSPDTVDYLHRFEPADPCRGLRTVDLLSGDVLVLRRSVFEAVGGMDEVASRDLCAIDLSLKLDALEFDRLMDHGIMLAHPDVAPRRCLMMPPEDAAWLQRRHGAAIGQALAAASDDPLRQPSSWRTAFLPPEEPR